jgi:hypothetical protein
MGGLTGFSSLAEGYLRLDTSGRGKPGDDFFNQPVTINDHPFLRQFSHLNLENKRDGQQDVLINAQMRQPNETELDYYERRYKERVCVLVDFFYGF